MKSLSDRNLQRIACSLFITGALALSTPTLSAQCGGCAGEKAVVAKTTANASTRLDIVDTAAGAGSFQTLVAAVKAAGLVDALKGKGPFTVFAPSDEAFARLPEGTLATLLKPENKKKLQAILTYHVVPGAVKAADVVKLRGATTLGGQRVDIRVGDGGVTVDGARVVKTDIVCRNGVIHVIDRVILPASDNLVTTAVNAKSFQTLVTAVKAAGLVQALSGDKPYTVLAPTDAAFAKLPAGTLDTLLRPENRAKLQSILKLHVIPGRIYSTDAVKARLARTLQGDNVTFNVKDGQVYVNGARVLRTDLDASNGVIHVIDSVILPE